jgi:hypothetical protein
MKFLLWLARVLGYYTSNIIRKKLLLCDYGKTAWVYTLRQILS